MNEKPVFIKLYKSETEKPESIKSFERLLIQNVLIYLKDRNLIDSSVLSMSLNILYDKREI